jgi:signal transduction histidine kinase
VNPSTLSIPTHDPGELALELRAVQAFADIPEDDLIWLAGLMNPLDLTPGEVAVSEGSSADFLSIVLKGELRGRREHDSSDPRFYTAPAGTVTGMLPYSRLTVYPLTSRATKPTRLALLHKDHFPAMLERIPVLGQRLVGIMADRIREGTKMEVQREKMMALGKLSAGLAHELNNPASAARRAAQSLREGMKLLREANIRLLSRPPLTEEQREMLLHVETEIESGPEVEVLDPLERSDREEEISRWLERHGVQRAWQLAPALVEGGFDIPCLDQVAATFPADSLEDGFTRLTAGVTVSRLVDEIDHSTARIADLVQAIKEYSYMDQMPEQEVDVHKGIESTLKMLRHRLKHGISIQRNYDKAAPTVCARGSELNQVWTNLIDNALDAMGGAGELRLRTANERSQVLVEIGDSGHGIPPEIRTRIFEPFFTTKKVGEGTGLGLDVVYRIVQSHGGDIRVESIPGDTRFQVRLPAAR